MAESPFAALHVPPEHAVTVYSLLFTVLLLVLALAVRAVFAPHIRGTERLVFIWLAWDGFIHLSLEGPFVVLSLLGGVNKSDSVFATVWKEYGKADSRWLHADPTVVSLEILTVVIDGFLCFAVLWAMINKRPSRHYLQVVLCVCELYGGWMTFCPEWLTGSQALNTANPLHLWVYLWFFNGLWVVVPGLLMWQSWGVLVGAVAAQQRAAEGKKGK